MLELTIVIAAVLSLIGILFIGSRAWKRGGDRASCILTMRQVQMATRSYQSLYGYDCGTRPLSMDGSQDIALHLYRKGYIEQKLYDQTRGLVPCPGGGGYLLPEAEMFPQPGRLYMSCSLENPDEHVPSSPADW